MNNAPVFLVAFQEQDNLGAGYIASLLKQQGFRIKLLDFSLGNETILQYIQEEEPLLIGFSIIFQYHIGDFLDLLQQLRHHRVQSHFCAGGHFPSLRWKELMEYIPQLDSVALFEGERTFLELARALYHNQPWQTIKGLAYRGRTGPVANDYRPLEDDLDQLPPPLRPPLKTYAFGKKYATLIAGRGCYYNCVFCSIREFYAKPGGKVKRLRRPGMVVREMELLHEQCGAEIFMFQDDDFPAGKLHRDWSEMFCQELRKSELSGKILYKINCRPDEVELETFRQMKDTGLFLVYLGIESGTDEGLKMMNKHVSVETNLRAAALLNRLDIGFDFGFMLLDPYSTIQSVQDNLDFLDRLCGDGCSSVTFCKMLPYAETEIERRLIGEKRIKGDMGKRDYDFLDIRLDLFHLLIQDVFYDWFFTRDGLLNLSRWARHFILAYEHFYGSNEEMRALKSDLKILVASSNKDFTDTARYLLNTSGQVSNIDLEGIVQDTTSQIRARHLDYCRASIEILQNIERLAQQPAIPGVTPGSCGYRVSRHGGEM